jgi:general stress protein 26
MEIGQEVLVIWDMSPDSVTAYKITPQTEEQVELLKDASNVFINSSDDDTAAHILSTALAHPDDADPVIDAEWHGIWHECEVSFPVSGPIHMVIMSGCMM